MKNRKQRVELMVELIKNQCIGSQEELAGILAEHGYNVTQATLSRDLKMLRTTKVPTETEAPICTCCPTATPLKDKLLSKGQIHLKANYSSGFLSLTFSGQSRGDQDPQRLCRRHRLRYRHEPPSRDPRHHSGQRHGLRRAA